MRMLLIGRGKMGTLIQQTAQAAGDEVVAALGREDLGQLASMGAADVVIDFSRPETLDAVCAYVRRTRTPLLSGTTGYTPAQMAELESLGTVAPVLWSANFSLGIAVFVRALQAVTGVLRPDFDIEITETHHNQKGRRPQRYGQAAAGGSGPRPYPQAGLWPGGQLRPPGSPGRWGSTPCGAAPWPGPTPSISLDRMKSLRSPTGRQPPDFRQWCAAHGAAAAGQACRRI